MVLAIKSAKIFTSLFWVACTSLLTASCYTPRYVYSPPAHNVPITQKKGESKLAVGYSSNLFFDAKESLNQEMSKSAGVDIQAAYAITDSWIVTGNYFGRRETNAGRDNLDIFDSSAIHYKRNLLGLGTGYNVPLNPSGTLWFLAMGGFETGRFRFTDNGKEQNGNLYHRFHNAAVTKFYLQPVLMVKRKKLFMASLSNRFTAVQYHNIKTDYTSEEQNRYQLDKLSQSLIYFWEPAFVNAFGFKKLPGVFLEYQAGLSLLLNRKFVDARTFNFSVGVVFDWRQWKNKKTTNPKVEANSID